MSPSDVSPNRRYVTFRCDAFNTTEAQEEYVSPENYGDDVASWLGDRLAERDYEVDNELEQDPKAGWYIGFSQGRDDFGLHVTALNPAEARWLVWITSEVGFFGGLLRAQNRDVPDEVLEAVHGCLTADPLVGGIRWHTHDDFRLGNFEDGAEQPC